MVALCEALEMGTCETCGCTPCDCPKEKPLIDNGNSWQPMTATEILIDGLASLIISRLNPMPMELRNASLDEVRAYLR